MEGTLGSHLCTEPGLILAMPSQLCQAWPWNPTEEAAQGTATPLSDAQFSPRLFSALLSCFIPVGCSSVPRRALIPSPLAVTKCRWHGPRAARAGDEEGLRQSIVRTEVLLQRSAFPRGEGRTPSADGSKAGAAGTSGSKAGAAGASGVGCGSSRDPRPAALQLVLTQHLVSLV